MNSADTLGLLSHVCLLRSVSSDRVTEHVFGFEKNVTTQIEIIFVSCVNSLFGTGYRAGRLQ